MGGGRGGKMDGQSNRPKSKKIEKNVCVCVCEGGGGGGGS